MNVILAQYNKLIEWWRLAGGIDAAGRLLPFYIDLEKYGMTTLANSAVFIGIESPPDVAGAAANSLLVFVIQLGGVRKTIKFKLTDIDQNNPAVPTQDGNHLLVSYGKGLARCFFYEIYGLAATKNLLREVSCLQRKLPNKSKLRGGTVSGTVSEILMEGGVKAPPKVKKETIIKEKNSLDERHIRMTE